jgi:hypothetical protein
MRSFGNSDFIEMPAFDLDSVLRLDEINKENMRGSYPFAHKFYTHIKKGKDGNTFVLPDGTKVWQVGIRSEGAYSLNLLFTKYHLPEGGKLFIYNTDHSHIIGSFDYRNNSSDGILPVRPVAGESIIVEYSEPADAEFEAELEIGEVNHDYRDILRSGPEPDIDTNNYLCMPDVYCADVDETLIRSTVLLIIDGRFTCTGTLINNTENDETPYLLTAVHCLNSELQYGVYKDMNHYIATSGTVVAFFNYSRSVCDTKMKATEEMSLAIAHPKVILEKKDLALLEFDQKPPMYYNAYYAGWSINTEEYMPPYTNIHHPAGAVKKYGFYTDNPYLTSYYDIFDGNSHLKILSWTIGSTHPGSSGSPLFDKYKYLVGGLSGGTSSCNGGTSPNGESDYFFALFKGWENEDMNNQLKTYLDPKNTGAVQWDGFDPHQADPFVRISNANYNGGDGLITTEYTAPNSGFLFGNSNRDVLEFAEEFNLPSTSALFGTYLFIPKMEFTYTSGIEVTVYNGELSPEKIVATQTFNPQYLKYSNGGFGNVNVDTNKVPTECFVTFADSVDVDKKFFVSYKINSSSSNKFTVYNTQFGNASSPNTAWLKSDAWTPAKDYQTLPVSTSLAIQPLLRYTHKTSIPDIDASKTGQIQYVRSENQLILPDEASAGLIHIYSVSGQLIQKIPVNKGQKSVLLQPQRKGTIGIVRVLRGNEVYSGKIIY